MTTQFSSTQPLLSIKQVAQHFSVGKQTIRRWLHSGELRSIKIGGTLRIRCEDLDAFVHANEQKRTAVSA